MFLKPVAANFSIAYLFIYCFPSILLTPLAPWLWTFPFCSALDGQTLATTVKALLAARSQTSSSINNSPTIPQRRKSFRRLGCSIWVFVAIIQFSSSLFLFFPIHRLQNIFQSVAVLKKITQHKQISCRWRPRRRRARRELSKNATCLPRTSGSCLQLPFDTSYANVHCNPERPPTAQNNF